MDFGASITTECDQYADSPCDCFAKVILSDDGAATIHETRTDVENRVQVGFSPDGSDGNWDNLDFGNASGESALGNWAVSSNGTVLLKNERNDRIITLKPVKHATDGSWRLMLRVLQTGWRYNLG